MKKLSLKQIYIYTHTYNQFSENLRPADGDSGLGGDSGEWELADGNGGTETGSEAGSPDAAAAGTDSKEIEIV